MKKITFILLLFVSITTFAQSSVENVKLDFGEDISNVNEKHLNEKPGFLFVLSARSGSFDGKTLILKDIPRVIYFSERPDRLAGHISIKKFVKLWEEGSDNLKLNPPNASISIFDKNGNKNAVLEIFNPKVSENTFSLEVKVLEGNIPKSYGSSSLFIDALPTEVDNQITD